MLDAIVIDLDTPPAVVVEADVAAKTNLLVDLAAKVGVDLDLDLDLDLGGLL